MQLRIEAPMAELSVAEPSFGRNPIPAKGSVTVRQLLPHFRSYLLYELNLAPKTVKGYEECLLRSLNVWGEIRPDEITTQQILSLKADLAAKGVGQTWTRNVPPGRAELSPVLPAGTGP